MSPFQKEIALSLYRWSTQRTRSQLARQYMALGTYPAAILFYHRVADAFPNDWTINNQNFGKHIAWVKRNANFASLDDIRKSQRNGHRSVPMVGLTFDDGYSENCETALPLIRDNNIPCTYFVSTHFVETGDPFPHDVAANRPLRPNSIAEIKRIAEWGITIGAHSHTHCDFGKPYSNETLKIEIADVRKKLQDWSQQPVNYFAFPYGLKENITQRAIDSVFEAGFECFVSASGGLNWPGHDDAHLQRIHGDPGMAALINWLTLDPRKLKLKCPISYTKNAFANPLSPSSSLSSANPNKAQ